MYAKLAIRNIKRSLRTYSIYFLTLVFCVAIFYVFNSLGEQPAISALSGEKRRMVQSLIKTMQVLSYILSGVVALLVLYADNFIIRRRKRELGSYMLLGMEQGMISLMLLIELVVIGLFALGLGLVVGLLASQLFALVVNRIFEVQVVNMQFVFSQPAAIQTAALYGFCFLVVGLLQSLVISRYRLIDMLGGSKNEEIAIRHWGLNLATGLTGGIALAVAYWLADAVSRTPGIRPEDPRIWLGMGLGVAATYLLFYAAAGTLAIWRPKLSGWVARNLNLFVHRQITTRINTNSTQLATITLMLTITVCALSTGLGLGTWVRESADAFAPFDCVYTSEVPGALTTLDDLLDRMSLTDRKQVDFLRYESGLTIGDYAVQDQSQAEQVDPYHSYLLRQPLDVLSFSAYQQLRSLRGYPQLPLAENEFLVHMVSDRSADDIRLQEALERALVENSTLSLAGISLRPPSPKVELASIGGHDIVGYGGVVLVVNDDLAAKLQPKTQVLVADFAHEPSDQLQEELNNLVADSYRNGVLIEGTLYQEMKNRMFTVEAVVVFTTFYVGVIAVVISATLLALQQLADMAEHRHRFDTLRKLGADEGTISRTIAKQLAIYFLVPLAMASVHSLAALQALDRLVRTEIGVTTVWQSYGVTMGIFAIIYGAYYALTYRNCQQMVEY